MPAMCIFVNFCNFMEVNKDQLLGTCFKKRVQREIKTIQFPSTFPGTFFQTIPIPKSNANQSSRVHFQQSTFRTRGPRTVYPPPTCVECDTILSLSNSHKKGVLGVTLHDLKPIYENYILKE